ncbi:MAG: hypothetical protein JWO75_3017 [Actinomycetia bacterium]|jgi:hypothetical protein|nr:hypothetical protein [Actinomycetes bacterium]
MAGVMIGVDPHKASHTAALQVALADEVCAQCAQCLR